MSYLYFARDNARFLLFGLLLVFCSSFGQTFFVSLFGGHIRAEFGLSHGAFGTLYSLGTLGSAAALVWVGGFIDRVALRRYATFVCAGLAAASFLMGLVHAAWALAVAFFALRLFGQGLMTHTAYTSMARAFEVGRGKAISIVGLGMPLAEAALPLAAVAVAATIGWRQSWIVFGVLLLVLVLPTVRWLLAAPGGEVDTAPPGTAFGQDRRQWSRHEVLRDGRFYILLTALLADPFIITGLFFHQAHVAAIKGWSLSLLATAFTAYAAATIVASLIAGHLVDRFGAGRLVPYFLMPLCLALLTLATLSHPGTAFLYLAAAGFSAGLAVVIWGSIWTELYGVAHIGSIRSLATPLMVFASALSPAGLGWLIDAGVPLTAIVWACLAYCAFASALVAISFRAPAPAGAPIRRTA